MGQTTRMRGEAVQVTAAAGLLGQPLLCERRGLEWAGAGPPCPKGPPHSCSPLGPGQVHDPPWPPPEATCAEGPHASEGPDFHRMSPSIPHGWAPPGERNTSLSNRAEPAVLAQSLLIASAVLRCWLSSFHFFPFKSVFEPP